MSEPEPEPEPEPELLGEGSGGDDEPEAVVESQVPGGMETPTKQPHGRLPPLDVRPMPAVEEDDKLADDLMSDGQAEAALNRGAAEQPQTAAGDFLYVQHPVTKKVGYRKEKDVAAARAVAARERQAEEAEASKPFAEVAIEFLSRLRTTSFFFSQGILAGISALLLILLMADSGDTVSFLHFFSPISRYVHGLLFWLTAGCFMGAVDKLATDKICGWRGGLPSASTNAVWVRDVVVLSLYGMSLILTFINAEVDLRFQFSESRAPSWYRDTPPPRAFIDQMTTWHALNALRLLLLIAAWVVLLTDSQVHVMGGAAAAAAAAEAGGLDALLLQDEIALGEEASGVPSAMTPTPRAPEIPHSEAGTEVSRRRRGRSDSIRSSSVRSQATSAGGRSGSSSKR